MPMFHRGHFSKGARHVDRRGEIVDIERPQLEFSDWIAIANQLPKSIPSTPLSDAISAAARLWPGSSQPWFADRSQERRTKRGAPRRVRSESAIPRLMPAAKRGTQNPPPSYHKADRTIGLTWFMPPPHERSNIGFIISQTDLGDR